MPNDTPVTDMPEYIDQQPQPGVEGSMKQAFKTPQGDVTAPKKKPDEDKSYMQVLKDMAAGYAANQKAQGAAPQAPMPAYIPQQPAITAQPASFTQMPQGVQQMGSQPPQVDPKNAAAMRGAFRGR